MSDHSKEVFTEVTPDPDAVLEHFGADSPETLIAEAGGHEPTTDDELDADDLLAEELFENLKDVSRELKDSNQRDAAEKADADRADEPVRSVDGLGVQTVDDLDDPFDEVFVGRPTTVVLEDDIDLIGDAFAVDTIDVHVDRSRPRSHADRTTDLTLSGPEPSPVRIDTEAFGSASRVGSQP